MTNEQWIDERAGEVRESIRQIEQLKSELEYLQIGWRPPDGGWSIGQVFEHLIMTDKPYNEQLPRLAATAKRGGAPWKPTMMGGFVTRAVMPQAPRKIKTAKGFQPAPEPRANVIDEYLALRRDLLTKMESLKGVDLNRTRMKSPVMGLIRYNVGDALMILTQHTQRHLQQIERNRKHPDFPKAGGPGAFK